MNPDNLHPQTREKYCETHEMFYIKNAVGTFICPFCEATLKEST